MYKRQKYNAADAERGYQDALDINNRYVPALVGIARVVGDERSLQRALAINPNYVPALETYGQCIGLAFQIHDDVLDEVGDSAVLGKTAGADRARDKPTYPAMMGLDASRKRAAELVESALDSLTLFAENADDLRALAQHVITREK